MINYSFFFDNQVKFDYINDYQDTLNWLVTLGSQSEMWPKHLTSNVVEAILKLQSDYMEWQNAHGSTIYRIVGGTVEKFSVVGKQNHSDYYRILISGETALVSRGQCFTIESDAWEQLYALLKLKKLEVETQVGNLARQLEEVELSLLTCYRNKCKG